MPGPARDKGNMPFTDAFTAKELPLRRVALRALSARPATTLLSCTPRTYVTYSPRSILSAGQWNLSRFQRRFASDETRPSESTVTDETVTEAPSAEESAAAAEVAESSEAAETKEVVEEAVAVAESEASEQQSVASAIESATIAPGIGGPGAYPQRRSSALAEQDLQPSTKVYVGNLFFEATEDDIRQHFEERPGSIKSVKLAFDHRGLSKGFAHIEFETLDDAAKAVASRNQGIFQGRRIAVQYNRPRTERNLVRPNRPNPQSKTLFIGNMSFEMSDKDLNDLFREVRNVVDVRVAIDRRSGQPRGFAHADFIDIASATKAKELLADREIYGRRLRVDYSVSSTLRQAVPPPQSIE